MKILISQCMIVKNEERNIERALSWGRGVVAEQIVVDTGSTDRTVETARRLGAKVYHFQWADDFAAAKNFAISKARYEWIAFLDADEYFLPEDGKKLPAYIERLQGKYNGLVTGWIHLDDEGKMLAADTQIRVFRNLPAIRYKRRIHEYLAATDGSVLQAADLVGELSIFHTGYGAANKKKKAEGRNLRLILKELEQHPDDWEMWGYLGNEYDSAEEQEQAEAAYRRAVSLMPEELEEINQRASDTFRRLLQLLAFRKEADEAAVMEVYGQAVKRRPGEGDYDYIAGRYYVFRGDYRLGEKYLRRALKLLEEYGNTGRSMFLSGHIMRAYEMLAMCCFNNGNLAECVSLTTALLKENPYLMSTAVVMLSAFRRDEATAGKGRAGALEVAGFLGKSFYDFHSLKDRLFILRAAMAAHYQELAAVMREMFTPEELAAVDQALNQEKPGQDGGLRIVLFYSDENSFNFFTDQLAAELQKRGHETFIYDLRARGQDSRHSLKDLNQFISRKVDAVICFDGFGTREDELIELWDSCRAVAVNILMDPPFRFHPSLEKHPRSYLLFCCDLEHVEYVKKYFGREVENVAFMPHAGVAAGAEAKVPYGKRKYDILFSGTYYRPQNQLARTRELFPDNPDMYRFYQLMMDNLIKDSALTITQAALGTLRQLGWSVSDSMLKTILNRSLYVDWAVRMYQRERVVSVLAEAGFDLYLLGRGWENHPSAKYSNVHRIDDRIPYGQTLAFMADAKINLNVMPWFKAGTHDRIFNALLQHSLPLTDASLWLTENFTDGVDITFYDLDKLEQLPGIVKRLLVDTAQAEAIIEKGYEKASRNFTWSNCADWILGAVYQAKERGL